MKKVMIDGPFNKNHLKEFIEDIANTDGYTIEHIEIIPQGLLFNCLVLYDEGIAGQSVKKNEKKGMIKWDI